MIPYYDSGSFLIEAVKSALDQSYEAVEIVIVDDASPNMPAEAVLAQYPELRQSKRIQLLRCDCNEGPSLATNRGIKAASGDLILTLDDDDLLAADCLSACWGELEKSGADIVFPSMKYFGEQNFVVVPDIRLEKLLLGDGASPTFLARRSLYDQLQYRRADLCEDVDFLLRVLVGGFKIGYVTEPLFFYRKHSESYSTKQKALWSARMATLRALHPDLYAENAALVMDQMEVRYRRLEAEYQVLHSDWQKKEAFYNLFLPWHRGYQFFRSQLCAAKAALPTSLKKVGQSEG